jgi:hypothetical protein
MKDNAINLIDKDQSKDYSYYKKLYYTLTMNNIKRNNNILFEGCDAHGLFYSCDYQLIIPYDKVVIPDTYDEEIQLYPELTLDEELQMFSEIKLDDEVALFSKSKLDNESVLSPEIKLESNNQLITKSTIDNKIIFDKCDNILNIEFIKENGYIKIVKSGVYIINLSCQFNEDGELIICINNIPDMLSLTKTIMPYKFITIHHVLNLKCDDVLSFHNYSSYPLTTCVINNEIDNVCLHIWMISNQIL